MAHQLHFVINFAANMRAIVFYISISFLLLLGGSYVYADMHHSSTKHSFIQKLPEKQQIKSRNTVPSTTLDEITDIDLDEEFHGDDDLNDGITNKFLAGNLNVLNNWYLTFSRQNISKDFSQRIKIFAVFCVYSNPIYIRQQVLRI